MSRHEDGLSIHRAVVVLCIANPENAQSAGKAAKSASGVLAGKFPCTKKNQTDINKNITERESFLTSLLQPQLLRLKKMKRFIRAATPKRHLSDT